MNENVHSDLAVPEMQNEEQGKKAMKDEAAAGSNVAFTAGMNTETGDKDTTLLDRICFCLLAILVFLLPIAFLPSLSLAFAKISLISLITLVLFILMCLAALKRGSFTLPKQFFFAAALIVPCVFFLSSLFSGSISNAFFGNSFEIGTCISIILGILLLFATSRILRSKGQIFSVYVAFFASLFVVALYQLIHLAGGPNVLSFGIFNTGASNLVGKWNELAIFFGLGAVLSLITLEVLKLNKSFRRVTVTALTVSMFFIGLVNFVYVDIFVFVLAVLSCIYFYRLSSSAMTRSKIAKPSLTVGIIALLFILVYFWGGALRGHLPSYLNPYQLEVSPSFGQTLNIAGQTLKSKPVAERFLFGSGPNFFQNEWFLYKPAVVNASLFWNVDFSYGVGLLSTYLVTIGIAGILAWLLFLGLFLWLGWKNSLRDFWKESVAGSPVASSPSLSSRYLSLSSFIAALYLWIFSVIYVPSGAIFGLTFIFSGIFIATLYEAGALSAVRVSYINKKSTLAVVFVLVIAIIAGISLLFVTGKKIVAAVDANDAVTAANQPNGIAAAQADLRKALALDGQDAYYRSLAQIDLLQINSIFGQTNVSTSTMVAQFNPVWADAMNNMAAAMKSDPKDYQNQLMIGNMYASVMTLGYPNAYENATVAYQAALVIDPTNPAILLALAQLGAAEGNVSATTDYLKQALVEKPNYIDAIYLLAQLQVSQNDIAGAIQSMISLAQLDSSDPTVFYQLGYLEYAAGNYTAAAQVLEQAVSIESDYSNARYFLGLAYYKLGRTSDTIIQFNAILSLNPGNQSVEDIIANLRAGKAPLAVETPATDQAAASQKLKNQPSQTGKNNGTSTVSNAGSQNTTTGNNGVT